MSRKIALISVLILVLVTISACDMIDFYFKGKLPEAGGTELTVTALVKELQVYKQAGRSSVTETPLQAQRISITPAIQNSTPTRTSTLSPSRTYAISPSITVTKTATTQAQSQSVTQAILTIPSLGKTYVGKPTFSTMNYNVLFVGQNATGDWPHCSGSINRIEIIPLNGDPKIIEDFSNPGLFKQIGSTVYVANKKANFDRFWRSGGSQFVYRTIPTIKGPVQIKVYGQVDWWENNCGVTAGLANENLTRSTQPTEAYPGITFGFFGGGCPVNGPLIWPYGTDISQKAFKSDNCSFTSTGAPWIKAKISVEAVLEIK